MRRVFDILTAVARWFARESAGFARDTARVLSPKLMDRYMLSSFLVPFVYCMLGFIGIWLVYDFGQNGLNMLTDMKVPFGAVMMFYITILPQVVVLTLPVALLLAFLYTLMRMSRRNEILSFLTAGVSLPRLLAPLFLVALLVTGVSAALNDSLAPNAERVSKEMMKEFQGRERDLNYLFGVVFRNRTDGRLWYATRLGLRGEREARGLQVLVLDSEGAVRTKFFAHRALYDRFDGSWRMFGAKRVDYAPDGSIERDDDRREIVVTGWSETPQQIASSNMKAASMGTEELREYLEFNKGFSEAHLAPFRTHLHFRRSVPWICFAVSLIAAPLAVVFSRRGMLASVTAAVVLFFALWFSSQLFLALGEGHRLPPAVAAWLPVAAFTLLGVVLLWLRSTNREMDARGVLDALKGLAGDLRAVFFMTNAKRARA